MKVFKRLAALVTAAAISMSCTVSAGAWGDWSSYEETGAYDPIFEADYKKKGEHKTVESGKWKYTYFENINEAYIMEYADKKVTDLVIPEKIDGKKVVGFCSGGYEYSGYDFDYSIISEYYGDYAEAEIWRYPFEISDYPDLKSISLPSGITHIGYDLFKHCNLEEVILPKKLESIYDGAFYGCTIGRLYIPDTVTTIGDNAFNDVDIREINFPKSLKSIGDNAFDIKKCETYLIPKEVKEIGKDAFPKTIVVYISYQDYKPRESEMDVILQVYPGSYGEKYAEENGYSYEYYEDYEKQPSKPQKVKGLKATKTFDSITLTWNEIENAEGYVVQQVKNGKWKTVETIKSGAVTSCTIEGLLPAKKYKFRVRAYNYNGADKQFGKYSNKLTVKTSSVPAVGSLTASKVEKNTVTLTWSGNGVTNYESGYYVEQYKNGRWVRLAKVRDNYTYTVKKLKSGTTYKLRVKTYLVIDGKTYNGLTKTVTVKTK